jgi:imidazolonepropionase-like amidohydrolase
MTAAPDLLLQHARVLDVDRATLSSPCEVWVADGRIRAIGAPGQVLPAPADVPRLDLAGRTLMPGLIDLHVHVTAVRMDLGAQVRMPNVFVMLKALPILQGMLERGFTSVRDAGGAEPALADAIDDGLTTGPRLFVSGRALSQTGGHGDFRPRSDHLPLLDACACGFRIGSIARVVDGVDAVRKAVREELQMGASQIKIMASGGVASPADPIDALGYSEDEIRAIVAEAAARHTYVMAHAYTPEAIIRAVRCGVRTIEHGNLVDAEAARVMAEHGAIAVPTLVTYRALVEQGPALGLPPASLAKAGGVFDRGIESLRILREAGVKIGFGTDLLGDAHARQNEEFSIRAQVLSPQQVLAGATTIAAEVVQKAGELGVVAEGAIADLLVLDGNPLEDIGVMARPHETLRVVIKAGAIAHCNGV